MHSEMNIRPEGQESSECDPSFMVGFHGDSYALIIPGVVWTQTKHVL